MSGWEPPSNKLEFPDIGNALVQGAHARYYDQRANHEAAAEKGRVAAGPDLPAAVAGDQAAIGRVAQNAPDLLGKLAPMLGRLDAHKAAQVKEAAEFSARGANAILQANPADRPALYRQIIAEGKARGHVINMPDEYSPQLDGQLRAHRAQAIPVVEWFKQDEMMRRHVTPGARAGGGSGAETDEPAGPPAARPPTPQRTSDLGPALNGGFAPPDVRQATAMPQGAPPIYQGTGLPIQQGDGGPPGSPAGNGPPVQPAAAAPPPSLAPPPGFRPMGHRTPDGRVAPATVNGKPLFRGPDGQLTTEVPIQQASLPAAIPGAPPTLPNAELPPHMVSVQVPGMPRFGSPRTEIVEAPQAVQGEGDPALQLAQANGPGANAPPSFKEGQLVYEDPALFGGKRRGAPDSHGVWKPIEGPGQSQKYRMPDGTSVFYGPHLKDPGTNRAPQGYEPDPVAPGRLRPIPGGPADKATTEIDPTLRGDELLQSLDPAEAAQVKAVVEGRAPLPSLSARMAPEAKRLRTLAFQLDPNFDSTVYASRAATQKDMADGKLAVQRTTANKLINHLGELHEVSAELNNSSTPLFNRVGNLISANRGDPRIAKFEATKHLVAEEAVKFFSGTGGVTVSGMEEMSKMINSAQSPQQLQGVMVQITKLLHGQLEAIADQYNTGMRLPADKRVPIDSMLSEDARKNLEKIKSNPLGQKPTGGAGNLKQLYGLE